MGRVLALSFAVVRRRWLPLGAIVILLSWLPNIGYTLLPLRGGREFQDAAIESAIALLFLPVGAVQSVLLTATALERQERSPLFESCLDVARAAATLFPFLVLVSAKTFASYWLYSAVRNPISLALTSTLSSFASAGLALLLAAMFGVLTPVIVAERRGLFRSLRAAAELLSGARWQYLALFIGFSVLMAAPGMIANFAFAMTMTARSGQAVLADYRLASLAGAIVAAPIHALWLVVTAVSYRELTRLRDGVEAGDIEAVFA